MARVVSEMREQQHKEIHKKNNEIAINIRVKIINQNGSCPRDKSIKK